MLPNYYEDWTPITFLRDDSLDYVLSLIEDALTHLFEFKVENHQLYFRELSE